MIEPCTEVIGVIDHIRKEPDGDYHIRLVLDPPYEGFLNEKNILRQHGALVLELICLLPVIQKSALGACDGFAHAPLSREWLTGSVCSCARMLATTYELQAVSS